MHGVFSLSLESGRTIGIPLVKATFGLQCSLSKIFARHSIKFHKLVMETVQCADNARIQKRKLRITVVVIKIFTTKDVATREWLY